MSEIIWIEKATVLEIHIEQLQEHGGLPGIRDEGALGSALNRPQDLAYYSQIDDIVELAVSYAHGIIHNHLFNDGNKRTGHVVMETFMILNGLQFIATNNECEPQILGFAAKTITEDELIQFVRLHSDVS